MHWIPLRLLWILEHLGPNKSLCQIWIMMVIPRCSQGLKNHLSCGERYSNTPAFASSLSLSFSNWTGMNIMLFSYHGSTFKITLSSWIVMNNYWPWPGCGKWASFQLFLSIWNVSIFSFLDCNEQLYPRLRQMSQHRRGIIALKDSASTCLNTSRSRCEPRQIIKSF